MPRYILKLNSPQTHLDYYLEWSTIVDAPVTFGMTYDELREYYKTEYGDIGLQNLNSYMPDLEAHDIYPYAPHYNLTVDGVLSANRAGKNETHFTKEQIIEWYCVKQENPTIEGIDLYEDDTD